MKIRGAASVGFAVLFLTLLALVFVSTSEPMASAQVLHAGAAAVEAPVFQVGDFWKYRYLDKKGGFAQSVVEIKDGEVVLSSGGRKVIISPEGNVVSGYGPVTGKPITYHPSIPRLQFPLWVGKRWSVSYTAQSDGWSEEATLEGKVVSWERIVVPAGAFDALKLELRFSNGNQELCYYAEAVKRFIKCDYTDPGRAYELETFRLGPLLGTERSK